MYLKLLHLMTRVIAIMLINLYQTYALGRVAVELSTLYSVSTCSKLPLYREAEGHGYV